MAFCDLLNNRLSSQRSLVSSLCREFGLRCLTLEYFLANTFNHLLDCFLISNWAKQNSQTPEGTVVVPGSGGLFWDSLGCAGHQLMHLAFFRVGRTSVPANYFPGCLDLQGSNTSFVLSVVQKKHMHFPRPGIRISQINEVLALAGFLPWPPTPGVSWGTRGGQGWF